MMTVLVLRALVPVIVPVWAAVAAINIATVSQRTASDCVAPDLICKAASNQDRSLYFRDRCRYQQKIRIERFKLKGSDERMEEVRETTVMVEPAKKPDKTGQVPIVVRVTSDTDKKGNPRSDIKED